MEPNTKPFRDREPLRGLFQRNSHSVAEIPIEDVTFEESSCLERVMSAMHPERPVTLARAQRIREGTKSKNYIITERFSDGTSETVVYRSETISEGNTVARTSKLQSFLHERQVPVPWIDRFGPPGDFIRMIDGTPWQRMDYVVGNHYRGELTELKDAARAIAKLHRELRAYPFASEFGGLSYGSMDEGVWRTVVRDIHALPSEHPLLASFIERRPLFDEAFDRTKTSLAALERCSPTAPQLIHADLHPGNLLTRNRQVTAIIDFGNACVGNLGLDLGMAVHRLVRQHIIHTGAVPESAIGPAIEEFLSAYVSECARGAERTSWTQNGTDLIRALPTFMRELLLRKTLQALHLYLTKKRQTEETMREIEKFSLLLQEVDFIETMQERSGP